jgi:predicted component of type VI protein secretion system
VLGGHEHGESLIRTAHGVGYAFTGMVQPCEGDALTDGHHWLVSGTRRLRLGAGTNDIGRDPRAVVWLDSPQVSRLHARITIAGDVVTLEDLGSKNCTLVNDHPVTQPTRLSDGDAIHIGESLFVFRVTNVSASTDTAASSAPR